MTDFSHSLLLSVKTLRRRLPAKGWFSTYIWYRGGGLTSKLVPTRNPPTSSMAPMTLLWKPKGVGRVGFDISIAVGGFCIGLKLEISVEFFIVRLNFFSRHTYIVYSCGIVPMRLQSVEYLKVGQINKTLLTRSSDRLYIYIYIYIYI